MIFNPVLMEALQIVPVLRLSQQYGGSHAAHRRREDLSFVHVRVMLGSCVFGWKFRSGWGEMSLERQKMNWIERG